MKYAVEIEKTSFLVGEKETIKEFNKSFKREFATTERLEEFCEGYMFDARYRIEDIDNLEEYINVVDNDKYYIIIVEVG